MLKKILFWGVLAGILAGLPMSFLALGTTSHAAHSMTVGYLTMLIALSTIFLAIKRHRDLAQGGVIRFWPALVMGLGISVIAGVLYAAIWDMAVMITHTDFAGNYAKSVIAGAQAKGSSAADLAKLTADMDQFKAQYANPLYRWSMTFIEIFPVGVLVSLVSAILLCNSRFLPARART